VCNCDILTSNATRWYNGERVQCILLHDLRQQPEWACKPGMQASNRQGRPQQPACSHNFEDHYGFCTASTSEMSALRLDSVLFWRHPIWPHSRWMLQIYHRALSQTCPISVLKLSNKSVFVSASSRASSRACACTVLVDCPCCATM